MRAAEKFMLTCIQAEGLSRWTPVCFGEPSLHDREKLCAGPKIPRSRANTSTDARAASCSMLTVAVTRLSALAIHM